MELVGNHSLAPFTVPQNGDPLDANVVRGNLNDVQAAYTPHDADAGIHLQFVPLPLPLAGTVGRKFLTQAPDGRLQLWRDNGSAWQEVTGTTFAVVNGQPGIYDCGDSNLALLIDWNNGPVQQFNMNQGVTPPTLTFANATPGATYTLIAVNTIVGGGTPTLTGWNFGENVPVFNTVLGKKNVVSGLYTGAEYLGAFAVRGA